MSYVVSGCRPDSVAETAVAVAPAIVCTGVLVQDCPVWPYSKCALVVASLAITVPFSVALATPIALVAALVTTGLSKIVIRPMRGPSRSANHIVSYGPAAIAIGAALTLRPAE